ncbi:hypothetical protein [Aliikangiella sp. G2MR2-5]|uniref:hypothetical protein n=1 Tax=Aliikangiella sp. G2MR2-5 TaxID=2788943 RepID=UPI0018AB69D3|nr:hypothetical protein [Aliikangiella sp. G2MR2-5]
MANSVDLDKLKAKTAELRDKTAAFSSSWKKKLNHLGHSISRSGMEGVQLWFKSHSQLEEFEEAVAELVKASEEPDFKLLQVYTTFSSFILPEEDIGQAEWYNTAHQQLEKFESRLKENKQWDMSSLKASVKELKFISQAEEFHQRYQIEPIRQKVTQLYQFLEQSISDFKQFEKERLEASHQEEKRKVAELEAKKAEAVAKKAMLENMKIKEKRLAIIEEKKRRQAEKEAAEAELKLKEKEMDSQAKQAELSRQAQLQDAYLDLQIEEKLGQWELDRLVEKLKQKIESNTLTEDDRQSLTAFIDYSQSKI